MKAVPLRLAVLNVGQGDTIVVSCPSTGEAIVVDCVDEHGVLDYLRSQQIQKVRALILTHLHSDHYRRAVAFLRNCERQLGSACEHLIVNPLPPKAPEPDGDSEVFPQEFETFVRWMRENRELVLGVPSSRQLPLEGLLAQQVDFLFPYVADFPTARSLGYNNTSIVLRVRGSGSSALLTGDMESAGWELIPRRKLAAKADVLKFPHHGAWKKRGGSPADAKQFLNEVGAKIVIFSVGSSREATITPIHMYSKPPALPEPQSSARRRRNSAASLRRRRNGIRPNLFSALNCEQSERHQSYAQMALLAPEL